MSDQSLAVYVRAGVHFVCGQRMQNLDVVPGAMEACPTCKRLWVAADRIDQLEAAGTALLNAMTGDDVVVAEAVWHELMGWDSL